MGGDYTRDGFDPRHDFSAVRMQQGRVQLDSDWNEQAAILDRRLRAGSLDAIGPAAVAADTPDAFRIRFRNGALSIGVGRFYVDGLLAENHGDFSDPARNGFDHTLGEEVGVGPTAYTAQPYLAQADTDPLPNTGNAAIAYLDVWQREIT